MKTIGFTLSTIIIILCYSCETIIKPNVEPRRINQMIISNQNPDSIRYKFYYKADRLNQIDIQRIEIDNSWNDFEKFKFIYDGDKVIRRLYLCPDTIKFFEEYEFLFKDGKILQIVENLSKNEERTVFRKKVYGYSQNGIISLKQYLHKNDTETLEGESEFRYSDDNLVEYIQYTNNGINGLIKSQKRIFEYNDNQLIKFNLFYFNSINEWEEQYYQDYYYSENKVIKVESYLKSSKSEEWFLNHSISYTYDDNGYLSEEINEDGVKKNFIYEDGISNSKLFSFPENLIFNEPTY